MRHERAISERGGAFFSGLFSGFFLLLPLFLFLVLKKKSIRKDKKSEEKYKKSEGKYKKKHAKTKQKRRVPRYR